MDGQCGKLPAMFGPTTARRGNFSAGTGATLVVSKIKQQLHLEIISANPGK
jgi:hypothetical protein